MASKARSRRTEAKKTAPSKRAKSADSPFFQPFLALQPKGRKATKAEGPKKEGPAKKEPAERAAAPIEPETPTPEPSEAETFAMYMAGVRALDAPRARIPRSSNPVAAEPRPKAQGKDLDEEARAALHSLVAEGFRFEVSDDGERIEGRRLDVDPRELRRLRRGAYTIDGRLDLHGKNAAEARREIESFIRKRRADGDRVVAVIVGRGSHSPRGIGVLRGEIAAWLSQGPAAHHVAAFASAPEADGGSAVVLALLAR
jgi:DNA-nicking Smr family endonuclease